MNQWPCGPTSRFSGPVHTAAQSIVVALGIHQRALASPSSGRGAELQVVGWHGMRGNQGVRPIEFRGAVPVLPVLELLSAVAFYEQKLGFAVAFQYEGYAGVQRDQVQIHFWQCEDASLPKSTSCRIVVTGIDELYEQAKNAGIVHPNGPIGDRSWGFREFTALDLCGNALVFAEPL